MENLKKRDNVMDLSFFKDKSVLVTGHTGFKGSWLCYLLLTLNAKVSGYALQPPTEPNLFNILKLENKITSFIGDVRNFENLDNFIQDIKPEIIFHLAAQPIVLEGYKNPKYTYETNIMGTVNLLESIRKSGKVRSFVNVTTDKVYKNYEWEWGYRENDILDGFDPYSNSKSCSELITGCYHRSFFQEFEIGISTARAGNVIGGGDFAPDRIIPDCIRSIIKNESIIVRNPDSIRPYQHVLEPIVAYLHIAQLQYDNPKLSGNFNIGPDTQDCIRTSELVEKFCNIWGENATWGLQRNLISHHESHYLRLDNTRVKETFGWKPKWSIEKALEKTIEWTKNYLSGGNLENTMSSQIAEYLKD
jgi:CDP-glucose 4,6-dehydratase